MALDRIEVEKLSILIEHRTKKIALDPNDVKAYNDRGNAFDDLGDSEGALEDYNNRDRASSLN